MILLGFASGGSASIASGRIAAEAASAKIALRIDLEGPGIQ
jgi:hypothetical protein